MLVHKQTMGVLLDLWTGERRIDPLTGVSYPVLRAATPADIPGYDPAEWWEIPASTPLGRRILRYYPALVPVVGEGGELLDALPERPEKPDPAPARAEAQARGYRRRQKLRPKNLFGFLKEDDNMNKFQKIPTGGAR